MCEDTDAICPGRTILHGNVYLDEIGQIASQDKATKCAALVLSASYYKEFLAPGSKEKSYTEQVKYRGLQSVIRRLSCDAPAKDAAMMLLIHHAIINPQSHKNHWTHYLYQLCHVPGQQANVVIAAHSVWLMAFLPLEDKYDFQTYDYYWLKDGETLELRKVNSILGVTRGMLYV